jgi:hypothetical protein
VRRIIEARAIDYNIVRLHMSLGGLPSSTFANQSHEDPNPARPKLVTGRGNEEHISFLQL